MTDEFDDQLALSDKRAARLAGVTVRQLRYWEEISLIRPSIRRQLSPRKIVRLYQFKDVLELLVVATLRVERDMSLQHIRRVVGHLRDRGYEQPLCELVFATFGGNIYFQHPGGEWEGDVRPDQIVIEQVLRLDRLLTRIREAMRRRDEDVGKVEKRRGVQGSRPIFAGTRVTVGAVQAYLSAGYSTAAILEEYPSLTHADVEAARHYAAAS
jgi:DNA-binding transcriptional MerR regulator